MRSITLLFIIFLLVSCAKKEPELVIEAIDVAQTFLSEGKCDKAIDVLEDVGMQEDDPIYLQVLASAYACKADFSEITFIADDIDRIETSPSTELMKSLTLLTLSDETSTDSEAYLAIREALSVLFDNDGGAQPSQANRETVYGQRKAGDMGVQALILTIVQLGKFINHYGNVNASGAKGLGTSNSNTCFLNYSYASAQAVVTALPAANNCNSNTDGHPDLDLTTTAGRRRACEGLVLVTNLIDILNELDLSSNESLGDLEEVATVATSFKDTAIAADPALETLLEVTSQSVCESTLDTASELNNLQLIYALIFETGLQ